MKKDWKLNRTVQCKNCPWKVSTDPHDIPNGYSEELHQNLKNTISSGSINELHNGSSLRIMACHESDVENPEHCVGWLHNQLGRGNNIPLRMQMWSCQNIGELRVIGEQHQCFEDTLPQ
jgi:hypothetical protein